jgi:glycerophosphoryl diester phosphodiesterase
VCLRVQALVVNTGLDEIAKYADAIGPWKQTIAPGSGTNLPIKFTTNLVDR